MKALLIFIVVAVTSLPIYCQGYRNEFQTHPNGLMYSESDMRKLRHMVDSLNLRFKTCDLARTFYSFPQTRVFKISFESKTNDLKAIIKELDENPNFYTLSKKYSAFLKAFDTTELLIKTGENKDGEFDYLTGTALHGYEYEYSLRKHKLEVIQGKWIYDYSEKGTYIDEYSLDCWFFPNEFMQSPIPSSYAALIQYVDCMIDTSATVMLNTNRPERFPNKPESVLKLVNYINRKMNRKIEKQTEYYFSYMQEEQLEYALKNLGSDPEFLKLLQATADNCIQLNTGENDLENMVELMLSKEKALQMKRNRGVVGRCSQDLRPREHARNIALLAAETNSWNIFLRSHLDIMNDRFERVTDGSYAYGDRQTYLKELEELNLNVVDLMLGLTLRSENTAPNHYYGTVWRTGWALTESKERKSFEARVLQMIKDTQLDEFNRGLIFMLYTSYLYRLNDEKEANVSIDNLKKSKAEFPAFLQTAIEQLRPAVKEDK